MQIKAKRSSKTQLSAGWLLLQAMIALTAFQVGYTFGGLRAIDCSSEVAKAQQEAADTAPTDSTSRLPKVPEALSSVYAGISRVPREDFASTLNLGIPVDISTPSNGEVLLVHMNQKTLPPKYEAPLSRYTAKTGLENCHTVKVVYSAPGESTTCLALMGQYESYHVHKYMRMPPELPKRPKKGVSLLNKRLPLRQVARSLSDWGGMPGVPTQDKTNVYWKDLTAYLKKLPETLQRLKPLAAQAAGSGKSVIVMVVNWGQAELLFNFVCAARANKVDLSSVLLFATDDQTVELAKSLDIKVFEVGDAFGDLPETAARQYGDSSFKGMMFAKVYCVHVINQLGYDLLFSDVDMIFYRDPLPFFHSSQAGDFDIYFQDDGARSPRYSPWSPNTGFYFIRHNERTQYFLNNFVRMGDLIAESGSHQSALNIVLSEHASWRGLKVKVYARDADDGNDFPGGFHYHKRKDYMKDLMSGKIKPYIFHMSWTKNKDNKRLFFQQMGDWYLQPACVNKKVPEILGEDKDASVPAKCCSAKPLISCHYRDKPSKIPCKDSEPIDKGHGSFW